VRLQPVATLPLVSLRDVAIRAGDRVVFVGTNWDINPGEHWAIIGANGSGKSLLTSALVGHVPVVNGTLAHRLTEGVLEAYELGSNYARRGQVVLVSLTDQRNLLLTYAGYHQARWNASDAESGPAVEDLLTRHSIEAINPFEVLPFETSATAPDTLAFEARQQRAIRLFGIAPLLKRRVKQLSSGETRKLLLARAVMRGPRLLVLDDPFAGLDVLARAELKNIVDELARTDVTVVIATSRGDEIPSCITHVLAIDGLRVTAQGPRSGVAWAGFTPTATRATSTSPPGGATGQQDAEPIVEMHAVTVRYGSTVVLDHVDFTLRRGERWAVLGPNGAGKSTLLSLILADNPQAYANQIRLFGRQRGSGESIWDIKARIGWVAPELLLAYPPDWSCLDIVLSGFFATLGLHRPCSDQETRRANVVLSRLGLASDGDRRLAELSHGNQRLVLVGRALVSDPELLVLDEPCQGLDAENIERVNRVVDEVCRSTRTSLIYVTHHEAEVPDCVTCILRLKSGRQTKESA